MTNHRRNARIAVAVAGVALLGAAVSGLGANPVQAGPGPDPAGPTTDRTPGVVSDSASATVKCGFQQVGDVVALARGPGSSVSARGWWHHGNCPVPRAEVSVRLQVRHDGEWRDIGSAAVETLRPGAQAEANFLCRNAKPTNWRSVIDVDLIDQSDDAERLTTPAQLLSCRPDRAVLDD